jgi:hypothetical protein
MTVEPSAVASRKDLCAFIDALADEHRADPSAWENHDLPRVLEALAAWTRDSPGYWANRRQPAPEQPDWSWVAVALRAATQSG